VVSTPIVELNSKLLITSPIITPNPALATVINPTLARSLRIDIYIILSLNVPDKLNGCSKKMLLCS
jgi:hypothetical protein